MTDTSTPDVRSFRDVLLRELPWIAGVLVGAALLVVLADAFQPSVAPMGADWWEYRLCGHVLRNPEYTHYYPPWRPTLYPFVLAMLGEGLGYAVAESLVASGSIVLLVFGAALATRLLAGPWAGAVAAVAASLLPLHVVGAHWTNPYPLLGGLCALCLATLLAASRWPRWPLVLAGGLLIGLVWAGDSRGIVLVPVGLLLVAIGPRGGLRGSWKRRALLAAILVAALFPGRALERGVAVKEATSALDVAVIAVGPDKSVLPMHTPDELPPGGELPPALPPTLESDMSVLEQLLDRASLPEATERFERQIFEARSLPPFVLMWIPLLALLPGRQGWRGVLGSLAVLGYTVVQVLVPAWLTDFGPRYAYFFLASVVVLLVAAPFRLVQTLGKRAPGWLRISLASLVALVLTLVLWARRPPPDHLLLPEDAAARELALYFEGRLQEGERWLECGILGTETHWYPKLLHEGDLNPYGADWEMCESYVRASTPAGQRRWLVSTDRLTNAPPEAPGPPFSSSIPDPGDHGWTELHRFQVSPQTPNVIVWEQAP